MKAKPSIKHPRAGPRGAGFERPKERPNIAFDGGITKAFLDWGSGAGAERHGQLGTGSGELVFSEILVLHTICSDVNGGPSVRAVSLGIPVPPIGQKLYQWDS